MKRSLSRILTSHAGSLPWPSQVARAPERAPDAATLGEAVTAVVREQARVGLAVVSDGELGRAGHARYVAQRLTGFEDGGEFPKLADLEDFPGFARRHLVNGVIASLRTPVCTGPVEHRGDEAVQADIARFKQALESLEIEEPFMSAASPGAIATFLENRHYPKYEAYLGAIADAMRPEYRAIVSAGFVLQVDSPDLLMGMHVGNEPMDLETFRRRAELHVHALNHALEGLSPSRMRMHVCWGNYPGPHHRDVPLWDMLDILLKARPLAISFPAANPRHAHEWRAWERARLTHDKILIPGVIDTTTSFVEHPELVAERILKFTRLVGMNNVIAGTDCGFGNFAGLELIEPHVAWAKLESLVRGAEIAAGELAPIRPSRSRTSATEGSSAR
jgi:5-methyltetrahydropteroyltriglutamate--homocysteine methyltransferase